MMAELDYDALQRLADAATPGPWLVDNHHWGKGIMDDDGDQLFIESHGLTYALFAADAEFIAAARSVAPALLDRVRELEAERDEGLTFVRKWSKANARWRRLARGTIRKLTAERDAALSTIAKVREAVSGHPECDRYEDGDAITCGWKNAYASVVRAIEEAPEVES